MADRATNWPAKADFLAIEQRWLSLARSYEVPLPADECCTPLVRELLTASQAAHLARR